MIYIDYNATCPLRPEALRAMNDAYGHIGNPSAIHHFGRAQRVILEHAREQLATFIGAQSQELIFTSGGSESNALAILGSQKYWTTLLTSTIEHDSVLNHGARHLTQEGDNHRMVRVTADGVIDLAHLEEVLSQCPQPVLLSLMLANNETGVVQPVREAAALVHAHGGLVHTDATQALGRMGVHFQALGVDLLTASAHKIGGPLGAGLLVCKTGLTPLIRGGLQEKGLRAGTENTPAFVGFAAACEASRQDDLEMLAHLRDHLEARLMAQVPDLTIYGKNVPRLPNTSCFSTPTLSQESQLMALDFVGIGVSAGAACASKKMRASHVLMAMGASLDEAKCALRVSLGYASLPADVDALLHTWMDLYHRVHVRLHESPQTQGNAYVHPAS